MSNVTSKNPFIIDTVGLITASGVFVQSVVVRASADSWAVVLHDAASGDIVFEASSAETGNRGGCFPVGPTKWAGIYATTLTLITGIQINLVSKG